MTGLDESRLDDPAELARPDVDLRLRSVAGSAARLREAATSAAESDLTSVTDAGRPRAVLALGPAGSGLVGEVLTAVAGDGVPVPVITHRGPGLPGWAGAADLVIVTSDGEDVSGGSPSDVSGGPPSDVSGGPRPRETSPEPPGTGSAPGLLSAVDEAGRRGCLMVAVGPAGGALAGRAERLRAPLLPLVRGRGDRLGLWAVTTPALVAADRMGLARCPRHDTDAAADRLAELALRCGPDHETFVNPAKDLAVRLSAAVPVLWGCSAVTALAARRGAAALFRDGEHPAVAGRLPDAAGQIAAVDGPFGAGGRARDTFADPEPDAFPPLLFVLLRDPGHEDPRAAGQADAAARVARDRGAQVVELAAEGGCPLERLASLVGLLEFAGVYLRVGHGPATGTPAVDELRASVGP